MSSAVRIAATAGSPTTLAATVIAPSARARWRGTGLPPAWPICCRSATSTWSSRCRPRSPRSPIRTRRWSTTCCSAPRPRRCSRSALIQSISAPIEVLGLAADKHHSVNRAGTAEQFAARHREPAAVGARLRLGGIEPVGCGIGDQPGHPDRNERPGMAGPTRLEQQYLVARVCRQPVRDGRTGRTGADNDVIVGLHVLLLALSLDAL